MTRKESVAIIIVNWNGLEHLKLCMPSLAKQTHKAFVSYVIDNNSTDESTAYIKEHFPEVKLIVNKENLGFAEGNNVGIRQAMADGHEYILLLNNDTTQQPDMIEKLLDFMAEHPKVGIAQPKLLLMNHPDKLDSCGSWLTRSGFLLHVGVEATDGPKYSQSHPIFTVKGAAMIIRRQVLEEIGLFDADFFAYFEETDLCWRAWLQGWQIYYAPVSTIYHRVGGSTAKIGSPALRFHSFKNTLMSLVKNLGIPQLFIIVPLHVLSMLIFVLIYVVSFRWRYAAAVLRAIGWNLTHAGEILQKRRTIQRQRKVTDKVLMPQILRPIEWKATIRFAFNYFFVNKLKFVSTAAPTKKKER